MRAVPRPAWVIALLLVVALLLASGALGGKQTARDAPAWMPIESRSSPAPGAAPHEAAQVQCPPRLRAAVSQA